MFASWIRRWLPIAALVVTLAGVLDPLEGFPVILIGGVLTTMAAIQERSPWVRLAGWGLALAIGGCAVMVVLSAMGGVGGNTDRSLWWLMLVAPYPAGVLLFVGANVLVLVGRMKT